MMDTLKDFFDYIEGKNQDEAKIPDHAKIIKIEVGIYGDTIYYADGTKSYISSIDTH